MKKILLLGDSIRLNYMPMVCKNLYGRAEVYGPEDNCRYAKYTLWCLGDWLKLCGGAPDVVHWNNGIWDITKYNGYELFTPVEEYIETLGRILRDLQKTGAHIIFATSTPVRDQNPSQATIDIESYNSRAVHFMQTKGIEINDLNALVRPHLDEYICDDYTHLSKEGIKQVGNRVTQVLEPYLD